MEHPHPVHAMELPGAGETSCQGIPWMAWEQPEGQCMAESAGNETLETAWNSHPQGSEIPAEGPKPSPPSLLDPHRASNNLQGAAHEPSALQEHGLVTSK